MAHSIAPATLRPLLIFDGDCGFCTTAANWAAKGWGTQARAVPWQQLGEAGLADLGLSIEHAREAAWWVDESRRVFGGHRAIGKALLAGRRWRRLTGVLVLAPPTGWAAAGIYRLVVRFRYRLPGATSACQVK